MVFSKILLFLFATVFTNISFAADNLQDLTGMITVEVNRGNACATGRVNEHYCWGLSDGGLHGTNDFTEEGIVPYARKSILSTVQGTDNHFVDLAVGSNRGCGVRIDGQALCWGPLASGLGSGKRTVRTSGATGHYPVPVSAPGTDGNLDGATAFTDFIDVEVGRSRTITCGIAGEDKQAWCWGHSRRKGLLGNGETGNAVEYFPVRVLKEGGENLTDVASIHIEDLYICAVTETEGNVYCWGENSTKGILGNGKKDRGVQPFAMKVQIAPESDGTIQHLSDVSTMDVGRYHSCAVKKDGELWCWGDGYGGAIADGNGEYSNGSPYAIQSMEYGSTPISGAKAVAVSKSSTCMIKSGEIKVRSKIDAPETPVEGDVPVPGEPGSVYRTEFKDVSKSVMCWGYADAAGIGNGVARYLAITEAVEAKTFVSEDLIFSLRNASSISSNDNTVCAVSYGQVYCWGSNSYGLLGMGTYEKRRHLNAWAQPVMVGR